MSEDGPVENSAIYISFNRYRIQPVHTFWILVPGISVLLIMNLVI